MGLEMKRYKPDVDFSSLPGIYYINIPGVFCFPVYNDDYKVIDVITLHQTRNQGYSAKLGELKGERLNLAKEMMMELRSNPLSRVINTTILLN